MAEKTGSIITDRRRELKKLEQLKVHILQDLQEWIEILDRQSDAELLRTQLHLVLRGAAHVEITDYFDADLKKRTIRLNAKLSPQQNLDKLFAAIRRAHRGIAHIEPRIRNLEQQIQVLTDEIKELELLPASEIPFESEVPAQQQPTKRKKLKKAWRGCFHTFFSDGRPIYVGKSAKGNSTLTFQVARGNDVWIHAFQREGAHVVIPLKRGEKLTGELLVDGARLAAYFSKARQEPKVEVCYTQAKFVKHIKGKPQSSVAVSQEKTLLIEADKNLINALLSSSHQRLE